MIELTNTAAENIRRLQEENDAIGHGLRFGLTGGGCSGYRYVLEFEDAPSLEDQVFVSNNVVIFVNDSHIDKLRGSVIGWKESLMEEGFDIDNPQAARTCGCGESVDIDIKDQGV
jgi:iron-sulfur cluster assembly accessory protein